MTDQTENNEEDIIADETPADRFRRIANPRLAKCQTAIRALGKCSGAGYDYTEEQVETIEKILREEVTNCIRRFRSQGAEAEPQLL